MKFRDIWDDHLHVIQQKTGTRLAIPLSLRCQALNISLRDVIAGCRDLYVSKYLVHYTRNTSQSQPGGQVFMMSGFQLEFLPFVIPANQKYPDSTDGSVHNNPLSQR